MKHIIFIFLFIFSTNISFSQRAIVRAVHDGDSYKVKFQDGHIRWIRLWGVDAPEVTNATVRIPQTYGQESGNHMRKLIKGKEVVIDSIRTDVYGRIVAKVQYDTIDLTTYVISEGLGWWFNNDKISTPELDRLKLIQNYAKELKKGLWGMPGKKIRPSTFRAQQRKD